MSYRYRVGELLACSVVGLVLICRLVGAEVGKGPGIRVFKVTDGVPFTMGKVDSRRILHPELGAKKLTLNYAVSQPGHEFPQHVHDYSDDTFLVLQGQVDVRQGDSRKPLLTGQAAFVPSGQIHGTITTGTGTAILINFQCRPTWCCIQISGSSRQGPLRKGVITAGAVKLWIQSERLLRSSSDGSQRFGGGAIKAENTWREVLDRGSGGRRTDVICLERRSIG